MQTATRNISIQSIDRHHDPTGKHANFPLPHSFNLRIRDGRRYIVNIETPRRNWLNAEPLFMKHEFRLQHKVPNSIRLQCTNSHKKKRSDRSNHQDDWQCKRHRKCKSK